MKKIVALTIVFLIAVSMVSIGAWAYFTSTELSDNEIYAGSLDLAGTVSGAGPSGKYMVAPGGNGLNGYVAFDYIFPGESGTITWVLVNNGTLPGALSISSSLTFMDYAMNEAELAVPENDTTGQGDLKHCVGVKLEMGSGINQSAAEAAMTYILGSGSNYAALDGLNEALDSQTASVSADSGSIVVIKLTWELPIDISKAGTDGIFGTADDIDVNENIIQGDKAEIDITFTLNQ